MVIEGVGQVTQQGKVKWAIQTESGNSRGLSFELVMIIASWNIRGLGKPEKRAIVRRLVKEQKISLLVVGD